MKKTIFLLAILAVLVTACSTNSTGDTVAEIEYFSIPISDISEDISKYTYDYNGVGITYFAVLGSDGEIRTAFDGCEVCGGTKGYTQEGEDIVCVNCGRTFSIDDLGTKNVAGGCWPMDLDHKVEGDYVLVSKADLESKAYMF